MKISHKVVRPQEEIIDIKCNKCGLSCSVGGGYFEGLIEIEFRGGYCSAPHFEDQEQHQFSLCLSCLKELVSSFIHPSRIHEPTYEVDLSELEEITTPTFEPFEPENLLPEEQIIPNNPDLISCYWCGELFVGDGNLCEQCGEKEKFSITPKEYSNEEILDAVKEYREKLVGKKTN